MKKMSGEDCAGKRETPVHDQNVMFELIEMKPEEAGSSSIVVGLDCKSASRVAAGSALDDATPV